MRILVISLTLASILLVDMAQAVDTAPKNKKKSHLYVGQDFQKTTVNFKTYNTVHYHDVYHSGYTGMTSYIGYKVNTIWSAELGGSATHHRSRTVDSNTTDGDFIGGNASAKIGQWFLDGVIHSRVSERLEILTTIGLEQTWFKASDNLITAAPIQRMSAARGTRVGIGASYKLADHFGARAMVRYSTTDFYHTARGGYSYSVGWAYLF